MYVKSLPQLHHSSTVRAALHLIALPTVILRFLDLLELGVAPMAGSPGPCLQDVLLLHPLYVSMDVTYRLNSRRAFSTPDPSPQLTAAAGPTPTPTTGPLPHYQYWSIGHPAAVSIASMGLLLQHLCSHRQFSLHCFGDFGAHWSDFKFVLLLPCPDCQQTSYRLPRYTAGCLNSIGLSLFMLMSCL
jgi:hypothetical protein